MYTVGKPQKQEDKSFQKHLLFSFGTTCARRRGWIKEGTAYDPEHGGGSVPLPHLSQQKFGPPCS